MSTSTSAGRAMSRTMRSYLHTCVTESVQHPIPTSLRPSLLAQGLRGALAPSSLCSSNGPWCVPATAEESSCESQCLLRNEPQECV